MIRALALYYSGVNPRFALVFAGRSYDEIRRRYTDDRTELERQISLELLSAMEAQFRIDYAIRCERRYKDSLSRAFRERHKQRGLNVRFEDEILSDWEEHSAYLKSALNEIRQAFRFRHWLAHGRYWILTADVGRFDFGYLYQLANLRIPRLAFAEG
jgi:hypothetical protein